MRPAPPRAGRGWRGGCRGYSGCIARSGRKASGRSLASALQMSTASSVRPAPPRAGRGWRGGCRGYFRLIARSGRKVVGLPAEMSVLGERPDTRRDGLRRLRRAPPRAGRGWRGGCRAISARVARWLNAASRTSADMSAASAADRIIRASSRRFCATASDRSMSASDCWGSSASSAARASSSRSGTIACKGPSMSISRPGVPTAVATRSAASGPPRAATTCCRRFPACSATAPCSCRVAGSAPSAPRSALPDRRRPSRGRRPPARRPPPAPHGARR